MFSVYTLNLFLALLFGSAIGLERESSQQGEGNPGGIRTHALIALLGAVCGIFYVSGLHFIALLIAIVFFAVLLAYYSISCIITKDLGMTSELAIVFTFIVGMLPMLNIIPIQLVVALFVVIMLILSSKAKTKQIMAGISAKEVESFISYAIIALVVLPFLPNQAYKLVDIPALSVILENLGVNLGQFATIELINPYKIWRVVALITGIDVFGYVLGRLIGNKGGFTLASCVGGFVSSTSTTQSLAQRSKKNWYI